MSLQHMRRDTLIELACDTGRRWGCTVQPTGTGVQFAALTPTGERMLLLDARPLVDSQGWKWGEIRFCGDCLMEPVKEVAT